MESHFRSEVNSTYQSDWVKVEDSHVVDIVPLYAYLFSSAFISFLSLEHKMRTICYRFIISLVVYSYYIVIAMAVNSQFAQTFNIWIQSIVDYVFDLSLCVGRNIVQYKNIIYLLAAVIVFLWTIKITENSGALIKSIRNFFTKNWFANIYKVPVRMAEPLRFQFFQRRKIFIHFLDWNLHVHDFLLSTLLRKKNRCQYDGAINTNVLNLLHSQEDTLIENDKIHTSSFHVWDFFRALNCSHSISDFFFF